MGKNTVKLYSTPSCPYCFTLKEFFKENNIDFEDIDVSQDEKLKDFLIEKTGKMEVPVLDINGEILLGFDRKRICELLNIKE